MAMCLNFLPVQLSSAQLHLTPPKVHVAKAGTVRRRIHAKTTPYVHICRVKEYLGKFQMVAQVH